MSIVEFDGPPSWSLDASETGESTKCPCRGGGGHGERKKSAPSPPRDYPTSTNHGHFVLSPVSLASGDQDGGPSNSTIDLYDLTEK